VCRSINYIASWVYVENTKLQRLMKSMVYSTYHFFRTLLQRKLGTHAQSRDKVRPPTPQLNLTNLYCRFVHQISSKTTEYVCTRAATPFTTKIKVNDIVPRSQHTPSRLQSLHSISYYCIGKQSQSLMKNHTDHITALRGQNAQFYKC
jgi:hypothetical protein